VRDEKHTNGQERMTRPAIHAEMSSNFRDRTKAVLSCADVSEGRASRTISGRDSFDRHPRPRCNRPLPVTQPHCLRESVVDLLGGPSLTLSTPLVGDLAPGRPVQLGQLYRRAGPRGPNRNAVRSSDRTGALHTCRTAHSGELDPGL
jgi:hypothetical protein